jgi:hypothetical protein
MQTMDVSIEIFGFSNLSIKFETTMHEMPRSRKIFLFFVALFVAMLVFIIYDVSTRTTFPGSGRKKADSVQPSDTLKRDSLKSEQR